MELLNQSGMMGGGAISNATGGSPVFSMPGAGQGFPAPPMGGPAQSQPFQMPMMPGGMPNMGNFGRGGGIAQGALQGGMSGASMGSMFGPWGAAIGGLAGAGLGGATKAMEKDQAGPIAPAPMPPPPQIPPSQPMTSKSTPPTAGPSAVGKKAGVDPRALAYLRALVPGAR
jgi:hypothetical protein